jgi:hypothetical protein
MSSQVQSISAKGKQIAVPALHLGPKIMVLIRGTFLKVGKVHDEFWLHPKDLPDPTEIIEKLKKASYPPDLFTFEQKLPDVSPKYDYHLEWDNLAVIKIDSYNSWLSEIDRKARQAITRSQRKGVVTKIVPFTDELVNGICSIYNETPVRQGKAFWHYNKPFSVVKHENGTYPESSVFVGAYHEDELIGFIKLIMNGEVASLMQILSKISHADKNPTNALLAKAVEICESKQARYLTYGNYVYGSKDQSSLIDFKRHNGFEKIDIPTYYVPLTIKGRVALRFGLHKGMRMLIPDSIRTPMLKLREKWYHFRSQMKRSSNC